MNANSAMKKSIEDATILIVEDSQDYLLLLSTLLAQLNFKNIRHAANYDDAIKKLRTETVDLLLIDIDLGPGKNGIQLAETVREINIDAPIIFMTSFYTEAQYERSRHTRPSSFMSKELSRLKLHQAVELALMQQQEKTPAPASHSKPTPPPPLITHDNYFFKVGDVYKAINIKDIAYFFSDQRFSSARVHGRNYPTTVQLKTLAEELHPMFIRTHKAYLVNLGFVTAIHPGDSAIEVAGETLPLGYAYRKYFMDSLRLIR